MLWTAHRISFRAYWVVAVACVVTAASCNRGPRAIPATRFKPKAICAKVLELYDTDGDDALSATELESSPGLKYAARRADASGDDSLDRSELIAMVDAWNQKAIGLLTLRCNVQYKRRPLQGAAIRLEPEPFLEGLVEAAHGVTDEFGDAFLTVPKEKRPIPDAPPGVQLGLYRVIVSKTKAGEETIPAKYNQATELGQEVSFDDPGVMNGIKYELKR